MRVHNRPRTIEVVVNDCPESVEFRAIRGQPMARNARFASMTSRPVRRLLLTLVGHTIFSVRDLGPKPNGRRWLPAAGQSARQLVGRGTARNGRAADRRADRQV